MTIYKYHRLFVLSVLICAIPVSDAYCSPIVTNLSEEEKKDDNWDIASEDDNSNRVNKNDNKDDSDDEWDIVSKDDSNDDWDQVSPQEVILSDSVKNCVLCNRLTVQYLNALYKGEGKEHKEHVIAFLRGVAELGVEESGYNDRNIKPFINNLINNESISFVMDRLEYIAKGEQYVKNIISGNAKQVPQSNQKEYLDSIISITWYFYAKALQKGDGFSKSASFNIQSKKLMDFFMDYYHQVREWHSEFLNTGAAWAAQYAQCGTNKLGDHPFAYERCSSHLKDLNKTNYGIDIRFVSDSQLALHELLPDGKAHLLFIPYDSDKGRFLLKPESHGTTVFDLSDAIAHGLEFLHGSKDDDYDYTRREKIKKDVKFKELQARYEKIISGRGEALADLDTVKAHVSDVDDSKGIKVLGVQHMLKQLNHLISKSKGKCLKNLLTLRADLKNSYTDNHDIRFAHEVVFKENDFR